MAEAKPENFKEIKEILNTFPADPCSNDQPEKLFELSRNTEGKGEIVEIGTNIGKSAISLAFGQKVGKGRKIHTIDVYEHPQIEENLKKTGVEDYVKRIVKPSAKVAKEWSRPIELLWIDGDHSYLGVKKDLRNWVPHVIKGGLIVMHDYPGHKGSKEVWRALHKVVLRYPYKFRVISDREVGTIFVIKKISNESASVGLGKRLYWIFRDIRTILVNLLPRVSRRIKEKIT